MNRFSSKTSIIKQTGVVSSKLFYRKRKNIKFPVKTAFLDYHRLLIAIQIIFRVKQTRINKAVYNMGIYKNDY